MEKNRLEAFSDGVFAIVITLLILEIKVPHVTLNNLNESLLGLMPKFFSFVLSFIIIGVYWVAHHNMLHFVEKVDRTALWLNIFVLLTVCVIPFPTALLGDYPFAITPVIFYGSTLVMVNFSGTIFWYYCTKHDLAHPKLNPEFSKKVTILHSLPIGAYLVAMGLSFISVWFSYVFYLLVPLFFIIPNPLLKRFFVNMYTD